MLDMTEQPTETTSNRQTLPLKDQTILPETAADFEFTRSACVWDKANNRQPMINILPKYLWNNTTRINFTT